MVVVAGSVRWLLAVASGGGWLVVVTDDDRWLVQGVVIGGW